MKQTLNNTFLQLTLIYSIVILLITLGIFWKYTLQFHIAAIIIAILGVTIIKPIKESKNNYILSILAILLILIYRIIPYINNKIPLGYDAGIYKYGIEANINNLDTWILQGGLEPGFIYLTKLLHLFFSTNTILTTILIFFSLLLGLSIYLVTKELANKQTASIAILIYSLSLIQLKTFAYMYYKNIIALSLALLAIYMLKKQKQIPFIILAVLTGAIHRPTFYIFGLSYLTYTLINKNKKQNIINGIIILILTSFFYLGRFSQAITIIFEPVLQGFVQPGQSSGTFIDFMTYQYSILPYLPLAIIGLVYFIKNKDFNMITIWSILSLIIVYFQFFFYNRFIIMLDISLIILASIGFTLLIKNKKYIGVIITIILLLTAGILITKEALNTKPLISENELQTIQYLQNTEENAYVMSTDSIYSPYVLGYSGRKTIAPGLFDYNKHDETQWIIFWTTNDINKVKEFLNEYNKPLYIFIGQKQRDFLSQYNECFNTYYKNNNNIIYEYTC